MEMPPARSALLEFGASRRQQARPASAAAAPVESMTPISSASSVKTWHQAIEKPPAQINNFSIFICGYLSVSPLPFPYNFYLPPSLLLSLSLPPSHLQSGSGAFVLSKALQHVHLQPPERALICTTHGRADLASTVLALMKSL